MACLIFGAVPTKITHTTQAVRKDAFFSDSFLRWGNLLSWLEHHGRMISAGVSRVFRAKESARNAKTALYQKRGLDLGVRYMEERVYLKSGSLYEQIGESGHLKTVSL